MSLRSQSSRTSIKQQNLVLCHCGLPANIITSGTEKNPGRLFYGCEMYQTNGPNCNFFAWCDEYKETPNYRNAWSDAMAEIRSKSKVIEELSVAAREMVRVAESSSSEVTRLRDSVANLEVVVRRRNSIIAFLVIVIGIMCIFVDVESLFK